MLNQCKNLINPYLSAEMMEKVNILIYFGSNDRGIRPGHKLVTNNLESSVSPWEGERGGCVYSAFLIKGVREVHT